MLFGICDNNLSFVIQILKLRAIFVPTNAVIPHFSFICRRHWTFNVCFLPFNNFLSGWPNIDLNLYDYLNYIAKFVIDTLELFLFNFKDNLSPDQFPHIIVRSDHPISNVGRREIYDYNRMVR